MRSTFPSRTIVTLLAVLAATAALTGSASAASRIVYSSDTWIEATSPHGGGSHRIAMAPRKTSDIAATEDGRWIAALSNRSATGPGRRHLRQIYLIGPRGNSHPVLPHAIKTIGDDKVAISPHGRLIAFGRDNEIWVVRPDGTGMRQVTEGRQGTAIEPEFTPDGRSLVFSRFTGRSGARIYRTKLSGGAEVPLTPPGTSLSPTISSSGLIAYLEVAGESVRLQTMRPGGGRKRTVLRSRHGEALSSPDFSPSGRSLVLVGGRGYRFVERRYAIFTVRAGGGPRQNVVTGLRDHHASPQWTH